MHLDDEILRAFADQQVEQDRQAADHLNSCTQCRDRLAVMRERTRRVNAHLAALDPHPAEAPRPARLAFDQLSRRAGLDGTTLEKEHMLKTIFSPRFRAAWMGLTALVLVAVAFSFPSVRAFASDLLARFRVSQITVVEVNNNRLNELVGNTALAKQIGQLISDSVNVTKEPGKPRVVASAKEASQATGFTVRVAGNRSDAPTITVEDGGAFELIVNRARAQMLLNEAGAGNIKLPASIDGANIKVSIPAGASISYGECPKPGDPSAAQTTAQNGTVRRYPNCMMLVEIPSPTVDTPPDLDVRQLAELALEFSGMSAAEAQQFSRKVDWTSTLVIPIPRGAATHKELTVDGTTGYLIQRPVNDAPQFVITWVKNGIIHAVGGFGSDTSAALSIANSLK